MWLDQLNPVTRNFFLSGAETNTPVLGQVVSIQLQKWQGPVADPLAGPSTLTEDGGGWYHFPLQSSDLDTLGPLDYHLAWNAGANAARETDQIVVHADGAAYIASLLAAGVDVLSFAGFGTGPVVLGHLLNTLFYMTGLVDTSAFAPTTTVFDTNLPVGNVGLWPGMVINFLGSSGWISNKAAGQFRAVASAAVVGGKVRLTLATALPVAPTNAVTFYAVGPAV